MLLQKIKNTIVWLVILIILLYTGVAFVLSRIDYAHSTIEHLLSEQLHTNISFEHVKGRLKFINPQLRFSNVIVHGNSKNLPVQKIARLDVTINPIASLFSRTLIIRSVHANNALFNVITEDNQVFAQNGKLSELVGSLLDKYFSVQHFDCENINVHLYGKKNQIDNIITIERFKTWQNARSVVVQSRFLLNSSAITLHGNIRNNNSAGKIDADIDFYTLSLDFAPWINALLPAKVTELSTQNFSVSTKIAFNKKQQRWKLNSRFNLPEMSFFINKKRIFTQDLKGEIAADGNGFQQWTTHLNLNDFIVNQIKYPNSNLSVTRTLDKSAPKLQITVEKTDLAALKQALVSSELLHKEGQSVLEVLNPEGNLSKTAITLFPQQKNFGFRAETEFHNVSLDAWEGAPSGKNLSGKVTMNDREGTIDIDSQSASINLQDIFSKEWYYDTIKGRLLWHVTPETYTLSTDEAIATTTILHTDHDDSQIKSHGRVNLKLDIPLGSEAPVSMDLKVHVDKQDTQNAKQYLPTGVLPPNLTQWIQQNITSGYVADTTFSWDGPLEALAPEDFKWNLAFNIANAQIDYSKQWPAITAVNAAVNMNQDHLHIAHASGAIYNSKVSDINANIESFRRPVLQLSAQSRISGEDALAIFQSSPINHKLKQAPQQWRIKGNFDTTLSLQLPLGKENTLPLTAVKVGTSVKNGRFSVLSHKIDITDIDGSVDYSSTTGLQAKNIQALLFNRPVTFSIDSELLKEQERITYIYCNGHADFTSFQPFVPDYFSHFIKGDTDYKIRLGIPENENYFIDLTSNLKGLTMDVPGDLGKDKAQERPFYLLLTPLKNEKLNLHIEYGKLLNTTLCMQDEQLTSGSVVFNPQDDMVGIKPEKGITVSGAIDEINLDHWYNWLKKYSPPTMFASARLPLITKNLVVNNIRLKNYTTGNINLNSEIKDDAVISHFTSKQATGIITQIKDQPLSVTLNTLNLPGDTIQQLTEFHTRENKQKSSVRPPALPAMHFVVKQINIGDTPYGKIGFNLESKDNGLILQQMDIFWRGLQINGTLTWKVTGKNEQTSGFEGTLKTNNLNNVFKSWNFAHPSFSAKAGKVKIDTSWCGDPFSFGFVKSKGHASFLLQDGKIAKTSEVDKLHILGLLNINTITKRLRLDFSDIFDSGIFFDNAKGDISFTKGIINLDTPVIIDGPSANFNFEGMINMPNRHVDLKMVVSLPIAQNLPALSLLFGQPALAGAIYLFDKFAGKKIMKFSSLRYNITGPLDSPEIVIDKGFANKLKTTNPSPENKTKAAH